MKFLEADRIINTIRVEAKRQGGLTEPELAAKCGCSASTIAHRAGKRELPFLTFWTVSRIAEVAGYSIKFERGNK